MAKLIYLASPYTHPDAAVRERRFLAAAIAVGIMAQRGELALSPIAHSHHAATLCGMGLDWRAWQRLDLEQLRRCDALAVLTLPGWELSVGVRAEIAAARKMDKPVTYRRGLANAAWRKSGE